MKYQIKRRITGEVMFECELSAEVATESDSIKLGFVVKAAVSARANLAGAYLADAYLADANLAGAYLADANLAGAYLAGANLAGAYLARANLAGAYLARANLAGAYLARAYLAGAYLADAKALTPEQRAAANLAPITAEEIARLDAVREIVLKKPERLDMSTWHSGKWNFTHTPEEEHTCGSTHCIAGWLQALSPDQAVREMEPEQAGFKLAPASSYMFYRGNDEALEWLEKRGYDPSATA